MEDSWPLAAFADGAYHLVVSGPNGFQREFRGAADGPRVGIRIQPATSRGDGSPSGDVEVRIANLESRAVEVEIQSRSYGNATHRQTIAPQTTLTHVVEAKSSHSWYDFIIRGADNTWEQTFAGRVETGKWSFSDPLIGREVS